MRAGKGTFGPNFWKWLIVPGAFYSFERCYREYRSAQGARLVSVSPGCPSLLSTRVVRACLLTALFGPLCCMQVTLMSGVMCLELGKYGPLASYKEGQYIYM